MTTIANQLKESNKSSAVFTLFRSSRFLQLCALALVVQLAAAALLGTTNKRATFAGGQPVFDLAQEQINTIAIDNGDDSISLQKQDDKWQIENETALPADPAVINTLLGSLTGLKTGLPVASTVNAQDQMEVADDNYQRKLVVNGEQANTFLLGTSPGLRKAHLRRQDSNDIFSASLPVSDMPTSIDQWLDKSLLAMNDIEQIKSDAITFKRVGSGDDASWEVPSNENNNKVLDTDRLQTAVNALEKLRVIGLSDSSLAVTNKAEPADDASNSTAGADANESEETKADTLESVELLISRADNEITLQLEKLGDKSTARRGDIDQLFSISTSTFDNIATLANADSWFSEKEEEEEEEEQNTKEDKTSKE